MLVVLSNRLHKIEPVAAFPALKLIGGHSFDSSGHGKSSSPVVSIVQHAQSNRGVARPPQPSYTGDFEVGTVDNADQERFGLAGTYYIESVDTSKGPLGEAAFLDRASSINLDLSTGEIDGAGDNIDVDSYAAGSRLVSKESGWLVDLGYRLDEIDNEESDTYSIGAGKYVLENTAVVLSYINAEADALGEYAYTDTLGEFAFNRQSDEKAVRASAVRRSPDFF